MMSLIDVNAHRSSKKSYEYFKMKAKHAIKSWMYVTLALFKDKMKIESHYKKNKTVGDGRLFVESEMLFLFHIIRTYQNRFLR